MFLRVTLIITAMLLLTAALATVLTPREIRRDDVATVATPLPAPEPGAVVAVALPAEGAQPAVRAGDLVELEITSKAADLVQLPELGLRIPVAAGRPAQRRFIAPRAGTFTVVSRWTGRELGELVVRPAAQAR
jgi:hypothetical protein